MLGNILQQKGDLKEDQGLLDRWERNGAAGKTRERRMQMHGDLKVTKTTWG